jgi:UrcA family protein
MTSRFSIITAATALAVAAAAPVHAGPTEETRISVQYSDLDLSSLDGRATLEKRIQNAAREACGMNKMPVTGSRLPSASVRACYKKATSQIGESVARAIEKREGKS